MSTLVEPRSRSSSPRTRDAIEPRTGAAVGLKLGLMAIGFGLATVAVL